MITVTYRFRAQVNAEGFARDVRSRHLEATVNRDALTRDWVATVVDPTTDEAMELRRLAVQYDYMAVEQALWWTWIDGPSNVWRPLRP